jgi:hypothetical protein
LVESAGVVPQHLLLGDLGSLPQPGHLRSCSREQFPEFRQRRLVPRFLLVDSFVPQPSAPPPLGQQRGLGPATRPQPVRIPHHLAHTFDPSERH